ncbi:MAG TPA: hypothetical protein VFA48_06940 [Gammaproteobacteria bacterium]|nr:hypothetical protein [Gammaproteobacteria bacterium]
MNQTHFCTMGLLALVLIATNAKAGTENFTLAETATPITRTYPGVDATVLGIRTGMTVSQAEAIATKSYSKKTRGSASPLSFFFTGGILQTKPLVPYIAFSKRTTHAGDYLLLWFTTPSTDSTVYYIRRNIDFNAGTENVALFPPIDAIRASLIKKYGPPSYQEKIGPSAVQSGAPGQEGKLVLAWIFNKNSRLSCQSRSCVGRMIQGEALNLGESKPQYGKFLRQMCGTSAGSTAVFKIVATIDASGQDKTADVITVSMWDAQACVDDGEQVLNQFNAAVANLTKPKPQANLPGASESLPPGSRPLSFYGDIGGVIGKQSTRFVRPSRLLLTEDGSVALVHLQWSSWGRGIARATGVWSASSCTPSCATGKLTTSPARLTLWSPGLVSGHWVYRCFQMDPHHPKRDIYDRACIHGEEYDPLLQ